MCGHYEAMLYLHLLKGMKLAEIDEDEAPRAIAPTLSAPIIVRDGETGQDGVMEARFGLVPHWHRGSLRDWKATTFNARVEDAAVKPAFKGPWKYRHCVVPAERFYEWSGAGRDRRKYGIVRADNRPMAFAGLWDEARPTEGDLYSFAILTRAAGPDMAAIHDREPCVLDLDLWQDWLACRPVDLAAYTPLRLGDLTPAPAQGSLF